MPTSFTGNSWLALSIFVLHIVGNFIVARPNPGLEAMLRTYTFMPPLWVFSIWFVIWTLQAMLFYETFGTQLWTSLNTGLFVLMCAGNLGSQMSGAYGFGGLVYMGFLACMLISSIFFMEHAAGFASGFPIVASASQLYTGWASLAFVVGLGAVLVAERQAISNATYSIIGNIVLSFVPLLIWILWLTEKADYRMVSVPYALVIFAFGLRFLTR